MKYFKQITIIMLISFLGELLNKIIPLPIPGSIYGIIIMFTCLAIGVIKIDDVKNVGDILIAYMPLMFISPIVGLVASYDQYKNIIIPILLICIITTFSTLIITGRVSQRILRIINKKKGEERNDG